MLHTVFFWLKTDVTAEDRRTFEAELAKVASLEYLADGFCGKPAPTEERPVTDHSFSYSLTLRFKTMEDHDYYQKDCPAHRRFIEKGRSLWEKVRVYDSESIVPG